MKKSKKSFYLIIGIIIIVLLIGYGVVNDITSHQNQRHFLKAIRLWHKGLPKPMRHTKIWVNNYKRMNPTVSEVIGKHTHQAYYSRNVVHINSKDNFKYYEHDYNKKHRLLLDEVLANGGKRRKRPYYKELSKHKFEIISNNESLRNSLNHTTGKPLSSDVEIYVIIKGKQVQFIYPTSQSDKLLGTFYPKKKSHKNRKRNQRGGFAYAYEYKPRHYQIRRLPRPTQNQLLR